MLVTTLLAAWLEQAPIQAPIPTSSSVLNLVTAVLTMLTVLSTAVLGVLKFLDKAKIRGLEKEREVLKDIATSMAAAVDEIKPVLSSLDAKEVTNAIQRHAGTRGVLAPLDALLAEKGLNQKTRDDLGQDVPPPQPPPTPPGGGGGGC